jgi:hypothetical protein
VIDFTPALRRELGERLVAHERRAHPLDGRRHAAVAIVLVDSDPVEDDGDPLTGGDIDMTVITSEL